MGCWPWNCASFFYWNDFCYSYMSVMKKLQSHCSYDFYLEACQRQTWTQHLSPFILPGSTGLKQNPEIFFVAPPPILLPTFHLFSLACCLCTYTLHILIMYFHCMCSSGLQQGMKTVGPVVFSVKVREGILSADLIYLTTTLWFPHPHLEKAANWHD